MKNVRMIRKIIISICALVFINLKSQTKQDDILGIWMSQDQSVKVRVYKDGPAIKSKIIWFNEKLGSGNPMNTRVDIYNPDPYLKSRKIIGMEILEGLKFNNQKKRWDDGKIYDASSGRTWDAYAEMKAGNHLCVRGFWRWAWIGKSICFDKI